MGLLDKGREWANRKTKNEKVQVWYYRNGKEIASFLAGATPPTSPITERASMVISRDERDFIVSREDLKNYGGMYFLPEEGDQIIQDLYGTERIFKVVKQNNVDHFIFRDGGETSVRIHTVLVETNELP